MYPIEKYRYYQTKTRQGQHKIIAVTTYAGKTVRGTAICHENDTFDEKIGKEIAAARCAVKVAERRAKRAGRKMDEAEMIAEQAQDYADRMTDYFYDAEDALVEAERFLDETLDGI